MWQNRAMTALMVFLCGGVVLAVSGASAQQQPVRPKLATGVPNNPEGLSTSWAIAAFRDRVKERSNGAIDIQVFWGGSLYSEGASLKAMLDGAIEFSSSSTANAGVYSRTYFALDVPYLFPSADALGRTLILGPLNQKIKSLVTREQPQLIPLIFTRNEAFRDLQCNRKVLVPSDLRGYKVRTTDTAVDVATFRSFGAVPTPIAWAEVYTAGTQNMIQCLAVTTGYWLVSSRAYEWTKDITRIEYQAQLHAINVSAKFLSALPPDQQKLIIETATEVEREALSIDQKYVDKWTAWLRAEGKQVIHTLSDDQKQQWVEKAATVEKQLQDKIPSGLLDDIRVEISRAKQ